MSVPKRPERRRSLASWQLDMAECEQEVDKRVYALYGLTEDEIKLVEGAAR